MQLALKEARKALLKKEVPIGAVLVCEGKVIAAGHNLRESQKDPTAHAELIVLRESSALLGRWRLGGTLYTTLEPCTMCAGALVQARIDRLVFGALDAKAGGCGSVIDVVREPRFNHHFEVKGGVLAEASKDLLQTFFKKLRKNKVS